MHAAEQGVEEHSSTEHLVRMANDIGNFFKAEPNRDVAIGAIANHINRYWTRRMRQKLTELAAQSPTDLDELPRAAVSKVNTAPAKR
jgi:formate dehydrogenase subunit delta